MSEEIRFTNNYEDLSTDNGFQFEFKCDKCGAGYRSAFKPYVAGGVSQVLNTAGNIFGGILSHAASISEDVRSATWQKAHDQAFVEATKELSSKFIQCPRCNAWVCREKCWNVKKGLCKECSPDLGVEMAAAQSSRSVEEVWAHAAMAEEDKKLGAENWRAGVVGSCPECETPLATNAKFCPNCGQKLVDDSKCKKCGAKLQPGAKFCAECGEKV
ncbi:MAG TPA: zinc ribbon domain-containing protein [Candidatus Dojkabacteria bacterium]|nr:zinc ribbon domain-containing protein [Candidatus Dojkabacteria bacterium]